MSKILIKLLNKLKFVSKTIKSMKYTRERKNLKIYIIGILNTISELAWWKCKIFLFWMLQVLLRFQIYWQLIFLFVIIIFHLKLVWLGNCFVLCIIIIGCISFIPDFSNQIIPNTKNLISRYLFWGEKAKKSS